MKKIKQTLHELKHHSPFTIIATLMAIVIVIFIQFVLTKDISEKAFEILHPAHIIVSSIVTTAIFYKYKKNIFQAMIVGIAGSIIIGTFSDVIIPFLGGNILMLQTSFHLPLFEIPLIVIGSATIGSIIGIFTGLTKMPHFMHVFLSVFASLFYLLAFSPTFNLIYFIIAFIITFIAVIIPCCVSDIVFPFLFLGQKIKTCNC